MAHKLHHPELMKIRNRYHLARRHKDWPKIRALVASNDPDELGQARELARAAVASPRRVAAMQAGARIALAKKVAFLRIQKAQEKAVRAALADLSDKAAALLTRAAGADGKLQPGKLNALLTALKAENRAAYARVNRLFLGLVRTGARGGIMAAMAVAQTIKKSLKASREKASKEGENEPQKTGQKEAEIWHLPVQPIGQVKKDALDEESSKLSNPLDSRTDVPGFKALVEAVQPIGQLSNPLDRLNYNNLSNPLDRTVQPIGQNAVLYKVLKEKKEREREGSAHAQIFLSEKDDLENDPENGDFEGIPDPARQTLTYSVDSGVFKKIFTGAMQATMEAGLFGATGISNKVWDLRDQNFLILKRLVAAGIAAGKSPGDIAADIQGLLVQPAGMDFSYSGPGIYRSAWKNAMRLARTESNRAYGAANALFAEDKGWTVIWHVSEGQREEDECDDLDGVEMTAEEFMEKFPQHPNCLCYSTLAVPDYGDDGEESDEEPTPDEGGAGE